MLKMKRGEVVKCKRLNVEQQARRTTWRAAAVQRRRCKDGRCSVGGGFRAVAVDVEPALLEQIRLGRIDRAPAMIDAAPVMIERGDRSRPSLECVVFAARQ